MRTLFEQYLGKRKTDIIIAVLELADSYGIRGITTKKIAEKVGFAEGALYKHINSKHEAFSIILDLFEELLSTRFKLINENEMKADAALREWFFYAVEVLEKYPGIYRIMFSDELYIESKDIFSKFKDIVVFMTTEIRKLLEKGITDGIFRENLKTEIVSISYLGMIQNSFTYWNVIEERNKSIFDLAEPIFDEFMNAILAKDK